MADPVTTLDQLFDLQGQVALVTGCSAGLGMEFAKALAGAGADVAMVARRTEKLRTVADEIAALGVRALPITADLGDKEHLDDIVAQAEAGLGKVDILVNNAAVAPAGRAEWHKRAKWDQALDINLTAPFILAQGVARRLIARGAPGRIINITSFAGLVSNIDFPTAGYTATKGALELLTRQLAVEWAKHGITVNTIAPGGFPTEMNEGSMTTKDWEHYVSQVELFTPMGRLGRPGELMAAVVYLASPGASFITGATLSVDGGAASW